MRAQKVGLLRVAVCPKKRTCEGSVGRRGPARQYGQTAVKLQHTGSHRRFRRSTGNREIAQGAKWRERIGFVSSVPQMPSRCKRSELAQTTGSSHVIRSSLGLSGVTCIGDHDAVLQKKRGRYSIAADPQ
jgi:hypothetical protein